MALKSEIQNFSLIPGDVEGICKVSNKADRIKKMQDVLWVEMY